MMAALLFCMFMFADRAASPSAPPPSAVAPAGVTSEPAAGLVNVRRVYVDKLNGGETAAQIRDLVIAALQGTRLFVITESEERADAFLRGSAEDLVYTDKFSSSDSLSARANAGTGRTGTSTASRGSRSMGIGLSENESTHIEERKHEALAALRLVDRNGDVMWSTTQESAGAKFRGASADVADKVAKQLAADVERARKARRLP